MKNPKQTVGLCGEDTACRYLAERGQTILERNWRFSHLEIDIITLDRKGLHFVEVKSRRAPYIADPLSNITPTKMRRIAAAANAYLNTKAETALHGTNLEVFFDVITVVFDGRQTVIEYYPEAFTPISI